MMKDNIFQKIINKEIPAKIVYEDDETLVFKDISPAAPHHLLIIPKKKVIRTHHDITDEDKDLLGHLHLSAKKAADLIGITEYRIVINSGTSACQTVPHLHLHLIGGRNLGWPPG